MRKEADSREKYMNSWGMLVKEYREEIHCKYCKKSKRDREQCEPYNSYCCSVQIGKGVKDGRKDD